VTTEHRTEPVISPAVSDAIREFAAALYGTPQFALFEEYARALQNDESANEAIRAYENKRRSLQLMLQLNAGTEEQQSELEQLRRAVFEHPTIHGYIQAQERLAALCQATANILSERIGLPFSVNRSGCCG